MNLINKIKALPLIIWANPIVLAILAVFYLNYFFDLSLVLFTAETILLSVLLAFLVTRHKLILLYILSFLIPLSFPFTIGASKINFPTELICVLLSSFFLLKVLFGYSLPKKFLKHPVTILILLDLFWMLVVSFTSQAPEVSFKRFFIRAIYYITFYYFYFEVFRLNKKNIKTVFLLHCLGLLIPIASSILFHATLDFSSAGAQLACAPFYNDHTMYGAILVFFIPFLAFESFDRANSLKTKIMFVALLLVFLVAAFLSYSRAAWLSLMVAVIIGIIVKLRISSKLLIPSFLVLFTFLAINSDDLINRLTKNKEVSRTSDVGTHFKSISNVQSDASNKERINRWKCALRMFSDKPILGFGPGTYQFFYGSFQVRKDMTTISTFNGLKGHAHSEYLNYLSETGIIGLCVFLLLIMTVCFKAIKIINNIRQKQNGRIAFYVFLGLITYFVHGFFNGFIEFDKLAMPVFMSFAAIAYLDSETKAVESDVTGLKAL